VVLLDQSKNIINIEEKPLHPKSDLAMFAIYYYTRDTVRLFSQYRSEGNPMDAPGNYVVWLYPRKPITTYEIEGRSIDVGTAEAYKELCHILGVECPLEELII
jgi:glucose-1-phosphate thymidylyltransferase